MAWTAPRTWSTNEVVTADLLNEQIRDNLLETMPAKAATSGGYFVTEGVNSIVERSCDSARVDRYERTTSSSYTDLATVGPTVTVTTGTRALVWMACRIRVTDAANAVAAVSWELSGATTRTAQDLTAIVIDGVPAGDSWQLGIHDCLTTLTPGENTFTMKYKCNGTNKAAFSQRMLAVLPF